MDSFEFMVYSRISQYNEADMVPEAARNFLFPDDQSGNSDVLRFCFVEGWNPEEPHQLSSLLGVHLFAPIP